LPKYKSIYKGTANEWKGKIKLVLILLSRVQPIFNAY